MTSALLIKLEVPSELAGLAKCEDVPEYEEEFDNVLSVLTDLCELLSSSDGVRFLVSGFGLADWGASVDRELCILLEQLPAVAESIAGGSPEFAIEFLEQGFWRTLAFAGPGDELTVTCTSGDAWTPSVDEVRLSRSALAAMLNSLVEEFCRAANAACPDLVAHPWFVEWRASLSVLAEPSM